MISRNQILKKVFSVVIAFTALAAQRSQGQGSYVNFEGKQTSPVRLSADGTRLFAVNTPDAKLSVFDVTQPSNPRLIAEIPVGVEPVSVNPRNNDEVWVVNEVSDSVSVVSVSRRLVTDTIYVKDEPVDVVFAGGKAFVAASRKNMIAVFDATNHNLITNIVLFGQNPRAMAVSADGSKLYAAFALSGNHTTLVPAINAPPQSPPVNTNLPAPPQVSLIVDASDTNWNPSVIKHAMPDNDVVQIDVASLAVDKYFSRVGTVNLGWAVRPGTGDVYVANTDARNLVHFEPGVRSHAVDNRITQISIGTGVVTPYDLNSNINYSLLPNPAAMSNALAQPTAVVFDPSGAFMWVAAFGSDRIAKVDASGVVLARIELCPTATGSAVDPRNKRGPRGLALNALANRLYVMNRIANTIDIIDTIGLAVLQEFPVGSHDPTPASIRQGRGFLYDAKLSGNGTMACASCHIDAEMDLIAWDLGDPSGQMITNVSQTLVAVGSNVFVLTQTNVFHPMKGPMTTQTLRGLNRLDPLHWRGDRTNFLNFNVAFPGLMGSPNLSDADMAAYRDFINTIAFQPNPNQNLDRTYSTNIFGGNAVAGLNAFLFTNYTAGLSCTVCHTAPPGPGTARFIIGAAALQESQAFKVPQLRAIYQKLDFNNAAGTNTINGFGFTHDGTDPNLQTFLSRPVFVNIRNDTTIKNNLAAFVQSFDTGTAPAVGYTRTVTAANVGSASISNDLALLEGQAALTNIDLIVKGTINGVRHGLVYQPSNGIFLPDTTNLTTFTTSQLAALAAAGDTLTMMGVPPGSGRRMGIDRDLNGVLDADETAPRLGLALSAGAAVLSWPYTAAGYGPEATTSLSPASWASLTDPWMITNGQNVVTNVPAGATNFYRLRFR